MLAVTAYQMKAVGSLNSNQPNVNASTLFVATDRLQVR